VRVIRVDDTGAAGDPYEDFLAAASPEPGEPWIEDEMETLSINYTSGTTGRPKGVMIHHRGGYLNAVGELLETGLSFDSTYLWTLPMFHCNGWCFTWGVTAMSATHVCLRRVESARGTPSGTACLPTRWRRRPPARARGTSCSTSCASSTTRCRTCRWTARPSARWSCAATTS